jgi:peptide/nickel transport system ATP-binding protein
MSDAVLRVEDLRVTGPAGVIVERMSVMLHAGTTLAIVGESGSGKSMTAKAITGLLPPGVTATGTMWLGESRIDLARDATALGALRGRRISLLLQNPFTSLSPVHRCGRQIAAALPAAARRSTDEVIRRLEEVDLPARVARMYPFELSGGMRQRVALAASLASDPEVLIGDEPTTALDVTTQREVLDLLAGLQRQRSMALVLITHDLGLAAERADRLVVMYAGRALESAAAGDVLAMPRHPYTAALYASDPPLEHRVERLPAIAGSVPRPWEITEGCAFAPRCPLADDHCRTVEPILGRETHAVACWTPLTAASADALVVSTDAPGAAGAPLVRVRGLTKRFGDGPAALDDVSIEVRAGEAVGVVGESGSGKTTLARCLVGLERAQGGAIAWEGGEPPARRVQIVFQDPASALNPAMTIGAALTEALRAGGRDRSGVDELLDRVGLPAAYARRRPAALSGGEQQRVAIARALAPGPRLLICDEAVSSLDVSVQAQILNLLRGLHADLGLALLFITHDLAVVRQMATRLYVMRHGRVVEHGDTDAVLFQPTDPYTRALFSAVPGRTPTAMEEAER